MPRTLAAVGLLAALLLAGCQAAAPRRPLMEPGQAMRLGYNLAWATDLAVPADRDLAYVRPLGDVVVSVEKPANLVTAVSLRDGERMWSRVVGRSLELLYSPVRSEDELLINSETMLYGHDIRTGQLRRTNDLKAVVNNAPTLVGRFAVYGDIEGRVFGHDVAAGFNRWAYKLASGIATRPARTAEWVFAADTAGRYAMIQATDGTMVWTGRAFDAVTAQPVATNVVVLVASEDRSLYALSRADGRDRWIYRSETPLTLDPKLYGNLVILPVPGEGLIALDVRSGQEQWRRERLAKPIKSTVRGLLMHEGDRLIEIDPDTGRTITEANLHTVEKVLTTEDEGLLLVSPHGRMLKLSRAY